MSEPNLKAFKSDGCSMWPDGEHGGCCVEHDRAYHPGGTWRQRLEADNELFDCVAKRSGKLMAWTMWVGVRLGGGPFLPLPWRWGFGHKWPRWK